MSLRRRIAIASALLLVVAIAATVALGIVAYRSLDDPLALPAEGYVLDIAVGTPFAAVVRRLHDAHLLEHREPLLLSTRATQDSLNA